MDYNNVYSDKLIDNLNSDKFKIYLNILLSFFRSDNVKLCFPDITVPLRLIIVEIAEDVRVLTSRRIEESCKPVCEEIIDVIEANRKVYKLICEGNGSESCLVLKKVNYVDNKSDQSDLNGLPQSLSMEDLNKKLNRLNSQPSITTGFKLQCLNTVLKFIKDDNQLIKEYPDITPPQAELIYTLICNPNVNSDIGFGYKSFYAPLWEAMKIYGLKYKFEISVKDAVGGKESVTIEKIAKNDKKKNNNFIKPTPMDTSESDTSFNSGSSASNKKKRKSDEALESLPPQFVTKSLTQITSFYNDDAMASITFNGLTKNEFFFYQNFKNIIASNRMRAVFTKSVRILFEKIIDLANSKEHFKLSVKMARMCNSTEKAVTFTKVPAFKEQRLWVDEMDKKENTASNRSSDRSVSRETGNIKISINTQKNAVKGDTDAFAIKSEEKSVKNPTLHVNKSPKRSTRRTILKNFIATDIDNVPAKDISNTKKVKSNIKGEPDSLVETPIVSVDNPTEHKPRDSIKANVNLPLKNNMVVNKSTNNNNRGTSKDRRARGISFQPAGVLDQQLSESIDTEKTKDKAESNHKGRSGVELNNRKIKLLEAMSVPIKSDKGLRMMRGMGWAGGALGLRGEGLTEPLVPALDRVSYAGLGHIAPPKPVKPKSRKPADFCSELLQAILQLITAADDLKVVKYQPNVSKIEKRLLRQIIDCCSNRSPMKLSDKESLLYDRVLQLLKATPKLIVRGCVSPCKSQIHLSKVENNTPSEVKVHTGDVKIFSRMAKIEKLLKRVITGDMTDMLATLEQDCQTKARYNLLEFRIEILIYILEFFKAKELKMTWCCNHTLNRKKLLYIDYAMASIDLGARFGSTEPEIALVTQILGLSRDFRLEYKFSNQFRSFTVTKAYEPKSTVNAHKKHSNYNNNNDFVNKNTVTNTVIKSNASMTSMRSDITDSMEINSASETTEEPVSLSEDIVMMDGEESPIIVSDTENYLLGSTKSNWDDESDHNADETCNMDIETEQMADEARNVDYKTEQTVDETMHIDCKIIGVEYETKNVDYETRDINYKIKNEDCKSGDVDLDTKNVEHGIRNADGKTNEDYETRNEDYGTSNVDCKTSDLAEAWNEVYETQVGIKYVAGKAVPDLELSKKCDNLDNNLAELEKPIKDADDIRDFSSPLCKRSRSDSPNPAINLPKLNSLEIKKVHIVHSNYPEDSLNRFNVLNLQEVISCNILKSKDLPLLKCHGIQDGILVYSCHTEKSHEWLKNTIESLVDVKILETVVIEDTYKVSLKFNCYFEFDVDYLFEMLELYNEDLSTGKWDVLSHNTFIDYVYFIVKMDANSYQYVRKSGFSLFAGVDEVHFSIIRD